MNNHQAFLLLSNMNNREIFKNYIDIKKSTKGLGDLFLLYHQTTYRLPKWIRHCNYYAFSYSSLSELNYNSIESSLVPGSNHFPVLEFYLKYPLYDYYWCIEDDMRFSGNWKYFFDKIIECKQDFLSCHIRKYASDPHWTWWKALSHPHLNFSIDNRLKSFNPIYRISNNALKFIHFSLLNKWCGHHEVLLPTLLYHAGYKIGDWGGEGEFVMQGFRNLFYACEGNDDEQSMQSTVRWRPTMKKIGQSKNKLYHPVKTK